MQLLPLDNIKARIQRWMMENIPLARRTIFKQLNADTQLGTQTFDVSTVHAILDGTDQGNTNEYFALCDQIIISDSHLQSEIGKRKLAMIGDEMVISPVDKKNSDDVAAAALITEMVDGLPSFNEAVAALLDGALWPLAMVEKVFRRARVNTKLFYELDGLIRVPPRLFDYTTGYLRIWDTDPETSAIKTTHSDPDPMRYITHRGHLLTVPDYRGGPMRSLVFWSGFSFFGRDWWARFLDRYGSPFLVGKYDQADDDSRIILENAFSLASKIGGLVISRQTDVEIKEALSKSSGEAFEAFLRVCNREKSKLIVGQTTSADAETGGLSGGNVAKVQSQVRGDIRQFDSLWLGNTLRHQLFDPFLRINGVRGRVKISWGAEESDSIVDLSSAVSSLSNANIEVTDEGLQTLGARIGLPLQRSKIDNTQPPGAPAPRPGSRVKALSALPMDRFQRADIANATIARTSSARLARAFSGVLAPVQQMIDESASADELIGKIESAYAGWNPGAVAEIILEALTAQAANGATRDAEDLL